MGVDSTVHIEIDELATAPALAKLIEREQADLAIMAGKKSMTTPPCLRRLDVDPAPKSATVLREVDGGAEEIKCRLPLVVTMDLRLNEPRYPSLPNIMKAKNKPFEKLTPADLSVDFTPRIETLKITESPVRVGGGRVANVDELVAKLKQAELLPRTTSDTGMPAATADAPTFVSRRSDFFGRLLWAQIN
ncbi:electron transfer flavoprotein subunit beta [Mycena amicta]|nr:electron transfer flavoprotein subunit beta [Mycena amicta]